MTIGQAGSAGRRRSWRGRLGITATALAVGAAALAAPGAQAAYAASTPQPVGVAPVVPQGAVALAAPSADQRLHLDVELAPRDRAALAGFVSAVSTQGSAQYHHFLARGQFAAEFGPTAATARAITSALTAAGLNPGQPSADGLSIPVDTTVAQAEQAFGIGFASYRLANGRVVFGNTQAPKLPASVAGAITDVVGLNDFVVKLAQHSTPDRVASPAATGVHSNATAPTMCSSLKTTLSNNGEVDGQNYWEPGSLGNSSAYDFDQLYGNYGNTGSGVTVGLLELENFSADDITAYQQCFGAKVSVSTVAVDGGPSEAVTFSSGIGIESALDIETVLGLAPSASIKVYQGPDADKATDANILDAYRRMVTDDSAQVLSTSWGSCELDLQSSDPSFFASEATIFEQAAAQGQTVVAASGDSGSTGCYQNPSSTHQAQLSVDDPGSQPDVTAVGGTRMTLPSGATTVTQSTWNTAQTSTSNGTASTGGVSAIQSLSATANYQSGVTGAGYSNACSAPSGATCRQVPDVSAVADPATGYLVSWDVDDTTNGGWFIIGGTSGAAPLWAALAALADASTACAANGNVGLMNPALYANTGAMTDVTTGTNALPDSGNTSGLYVAGAGYDLATGLGTPNAPRVVEALCGAKAASAGSTFDPVTPTRVLDTRPGTTTGVPSAAPIGPGGVLALTVTGSNGVPSTGVTAVVLNVTVADATASSYLTVYPDGTIRPTASNLNFTAGQVIPNQVTVPVGSDGKVDFYNFHGAVDVIADLDGYYGAASGGSLFDPQTPTRVLDTRPGTTTGVTTAAPVGANSSLSLPVAGANGVPASGVTAVVLNVTVADATASSYLTVYPDGVTRPTASNLNFVAGQVIPNLVTVPVGPDGAVDFYNFHGAVDVIADLFGYYTGSGAGYVFHASNPHRLADTRSGVGIAPNEPTPVGAQQTLGLPLDDVNGPGNEGPLATAAALVLNVTATQPTAAGYVTAYPSGVTRPGSSNLNFTAGQTIPNAALIPVNGDYLDLYNFQGAVQLVVDVSGYFASS
jgi:pro-kumamolisin-like protein